MSKMKDMAMTIEELRSAAAAINDVADSPHTSHCSHSLFCFKAAIHFHLWGKVFADLLLSVLLPMTFATLNSCHFNSVYSVLSIFRA